MAIDRTAAANAIDAFLRAIGRDAASEPDLVGTGTRVTDAFIDELCAGYAVDTRALLASAVIEEAPERRGSERDQAAHGVVVVREVPITTTCPHHLMLATGTASIALQPRARLVGIGALSALVIAHARRLTLQERIGESVVDEIAEVLAPEWVSCKITLSHGCMIARGERVTGALVETFAVRAVSAKAEAQARAAFGLSS